MLYLTILLIFILRGPYSPQLASDLFSSKEFEVAVNLDKFVPQELEDRFLELKNLVKGKTLRQLELLATYHWLRRLAKWGSTQADKSLVELKDATSDEVEEVKILIKQIP